MKKFSLSGLLCVGILLGFPGQSFVAGEAHAQDGSNAGKVYATFMDILESYESLATMAELDDVLKMTIQTRAQLDAMSDEELAGFAGILPVIDELRAGARETEDMLAASFVQEAVVRSSAEFPDAVYDDSGLCWTTRLSTEAVDIALFVLLVAEEVRDIASRNCQETVVVAGFGGNVSLTCIITDSIYVLAEGVWEHIAVCQDGIDSAEIEGSYLRLGHVHTDLENVESNLITRIDTAETNLTTRIDTAEENLTALILANSDAIAANAEAIERLRVVLCDVVRLLHTPQGQRESNCESCDDQPEFPYGWPTR